MRRLLVLLCCASGIAAMAATGSAQYMYLDSNGNGVHDGGDVMNGTGIPTTVDVWLATDQERDGSAAVCNTDGVSALNIRSYLFHLMASGGTVIYSNFINRTAFTSPLGEMNQPAGAQGLYRNGFGQQATIPAGLYRLATVTITGTGGAPSISIVDGHTLSNDQTNFGTNCDGNTFNATYFLDGPFTQAAWGVAGDWTDVDGVAPLLEQGPPVLAAIGNKTVNEGSLLSFTATATDPDPSQTLTFSLGAGAPAGAAITPDGTFSWTPTEAQGPGAYPVTVIVTSNGTGNLSDSETIQVTVNEVNLSPVLAPIGNKSGAVGGCAPTPVTFTATATDADLPAQTLTFSLGAGAPAGATIDPSTGAFSWQPTTPGTFPVTIIVTDNGTPPLSDSEAISINIAVVNQAPILAAIGNKTIAEGSLLTFVATATDACAGTLTFVLAAGAPAGAAITPGGTFTWTPAETQGGGIYSITVIVSNGSTTDSETFQVTVTEVNQAPVLAPIGNKTAVIGTPLTFTATATDADIPPQTLTFTLGPGAPAGATIGASTGNFSWTPTTSVGSPFLVTIIVTDNGTPTLNDAETIQIAICLGCLNTPPVLAAIGNKTVSEGSLLSFTATATDPDTPAQTLTFTLGAGSPAGAAITVGGSFTWTPTEAQGPGTFPITIIVTDNGTGNLSDNELIQVTVNEVNQAPVLAPIGNKSGGVGRLITFVATATDADVPANNLTFSLGNGAPIGSSIDPITGRFSWTPPATGAFVVTVIVTDNGTPPMSDSETISITVCDCPNNAPVLAAIGNKTANEQVLLAFDATATDVDVPAQTLTFSLAPGMPPGAAITGAGHFTWTPAESQGGIVWPVTVIVTDNGLPSPLSDSEAFTITVIEDNIPPFFNQPANMTVEEGSSVTQQLVATDADIPSNPLIYSKVTGPVFMTVSSSGLVTLSPTLGDAGTYSATVQVSDGVASPMRTFSVTVTPGDFAPAADAGGPYTGVVGAGIAFDGSGSADPHGATLTYSWDFGDGTSGSGVNPVHAYAAAGDYVVTLTVDNGSVSDTDATTAHVVPFFSTHVFVTGGNKSVRLGSGKPQTCVQIEPVGGAYEVSDVDLGSIRMGFGSLEIAAISGKTAVGDDKNQNGVTEITACFSKDDLRILFSGTPTGDYDVTLRGNLATGGFFEGTTVLHVVNNGNFLSASISPNPLNPKATVTFTTSKPGAVRVQMFDVQGRLVRTMMDESNAVAGYHDVTIDGHDANGAKLASGIYYVTIHSSADGSETKAITILK